MALSIELEQMKNIIGLLILKRDKETNIMKQRENEVTKLSTATNN